jgi:hypothetical protein
MVFDFKNLKKEKNDDDEAKYLHRFHLHPLLHCEGNHPILEQSACWVSYLH